MHWVTRKKLRIARAATVWLIRRFLDPAASFAFVDDDEAVVAAERAGAIGFHAKGARYPPVNAREQTAFEALVEEHCPQDAALVAMGRIGHDADRGGAGPQVPEAAGLRMISVSFPEVCSDDMQIVAKSELLYDALYYTLGKRERGGGVQASGK